jgi:hypothetical protein
MEVFMSNCNKTTVEAILWLEISGYHLDLDEGGWAAARRITSSSFWLGAFAE